MHNTDTLNLLWIAGASQGFLLAFFLFISNNRKINLPLSLFVFLTSIELLFQYLYASKLITQYPHFIYLSEPFSMIGGLLVFMYTRNILKGTLIIKKSDALFFIPFLLYLLYYLPTYLQSSTEKLSDIIDFYQADISWKENLYEWIAEIMVNVPFLFFSVRYLNTYQGKIKDNYSDISRVSFIIVRNLIITTIALYLIECITILLAFSGLEAARFLYQIIYIFSIVIIYIVGYDALIRNKALPTKIIEVPDLIEELSAESTQDSPLNSKQKYEKNTLTNSRKKEISTKILDVILKEKTYQRPDLRLNDLAKLIGENPNNVSQVLNDIHKRNFYDFINFYRIQEAKSLLTSDNFKNLTISAIGFEVGFNSKSAFYSAFKKFTGLTPFQFQQTTED